MKKIFRIGGHFKSMCAKSEYLYETLNFFVIVRILWEMHQNIALSMVVTFGAKKLVFVCFPRYMWVLREKIYIKNLQNVVFSRKKFLVK